MIYTRFSHRKTMASHKIDRLLGLNRSTDRLFKMAGIGIAISMIFFVGLIRFAALGELGLPIAALTGLLFSTLLLSSILVYLTATKITSYRSLHSN